MNHNIFMNMPMLSKNENLEINNFNSVIKNDNEEIAISESIIKAKTSENIIYGLNEIQSQCLDEPEYIKPNEVFFYLNDLHQEKSKKKDLLYDEIITFTGPLLNKEKKYNNKIIVGNVKFENYYFNKNGKKNCLTNVLWSYYSNAEVYYPENNYKIEKYIKNDDSIIAGAFNTEFYYYCKPGNYFFSGTTIEDILNQTIWFKENKQICKILTIEKKKDYIICYYE